MLSGCAVAPSMAGVAGTAGARKAKGADRKAVKVLAFDTGGTVLDWHGIIVEELAERGARFSRRARLARLCQRVPAPLAAADARRGRSGLYHRRYASRGARRAPRRGSWPRFLARRPPSDRGALARARRLARLRAGAQAAAPALCLRLVNDPDALAGDRRLASQRDRLGCGDRLRDATRLQTPARGLPACRRASGAPASRNPDGRLPQFRP